jgi:hypothetical protein
MEKKVKDFLEHIEMKTMIKFDWSTISTEVDWITKYSDRINLDTIYPLEINTLSIAHLSLDFKVCFCLNQNHNIVISAGIYISGTDQEMMEANFALEQIKEAVPDVPVFIIYPTYSYDTYIQYYQLR